MTTPEQFIALLAKWRTGQLSTEESELFFSEVREGHHKVLVEEILEGHLEAGDLDGLVHVTGQHKGIQRWEDFYNNEQSSPITHVHFMRTAWFRYAAAVVLFFGVAAAIFMVYNHQSPQQPLIGDNNIRQDEVGPGTNKAVLTVDDKQIDLASDKTGIAIGKSISYTDGERLSNPGSLMKLTTPRGGQYQIVLPDGSKVWLNAASSISFPSAFTGEMRNISVTGEAYLEIVHNPKQPFIVKTIGGEIQVLGTSFNINSYGDDGNIRTTLVQGKVSVNQQVILEPGQQAVQSLNITSVGMSSTHQPQSDDKPEIIVRPADMEQTLAWKNGIFSFYNADLRTVMKQLERWYDISVQYNSEPANIQLQGEMYRNVNLSSVLKFLEEYGVKFRMEDKKLVVL